MRLTVEGNSPEDIQSIADSVNALWEEEHNVDGGHSDVTADSVSVPEGVVGRWIDLRPNYNGTGRFFDVGAGTLTVDVDDVRVLRYCTIGQVAHVQFFVVGATIATSSLTELYIALPELHALPMPAGATLWQMAGVLDWQDTDGNGSGPIWVIQEDIGTSRRVLLGLGKYDVAAFGYRNWQVGTDNVEFSGIATLAITEGNVPHSFQTS